MRNLLVGMVFAICGGGAAAASDSINVFAIPSDEIVAEVAKLSDTLAADGMETFYKKGRPVHATLYLTTYPGGSREAVVNAVEDLAVRGETFALKAEGIAVTKGNWVFFEMERSPELQRLADETVMALEGLRERDIQPPGWVANYPNKLEAFKRYGSPNVFQNFQPHFTLLASEENPKLADFAKAMAANPPKADGDIVGIGVGIADEMGQITEVLAEYRFAQ